MSFILIPSGNGKTSLHTHGLDVQEQEIQRRVQLEIAQIRQATIEEAKLAGIQAANAAAHLLETELKQALSALKEASAQLVLPLARKEQELTELVLDMAFQLTRHMTGVQAAQDRETLSALITSLLHEAKAAQTPQQRLILRLHPSDISTLKDKLTETDLDLTADAGLSPGDAVVELVMVNGDPLDKTAWDARLQSRLEALHQALLPIDGGVE